jgi:hypothetical protein
MSLSPGLGPRPNHSHHGTPRWLDSPLIAGPRRYLATLCYRPSQLVSEEAARRSGPRAVSSSSSTSTSTSTSTSVNSFLLVPPCVTPWIQPTCPADPPARRRALGRALLLRSTSPLSPLPPAQYKSFTSSLSASFSAGEWLRTKPKTESQDAVANPFEAGGMDGAMDGMKKQAVMMWVVFRFLLRRQE